MAITTDSKNVVDENTTTFDKTKRGFLRLIFTFADGYDVVLMILGFLGAVGDGLTVPLILLLYSRLMNTIGTASTSFPSFLTEHIKEVFMYF